ncbi:hypothetical protein [Actinoplanes sp. NBRC 101535]|uniref:hypothetical protein n=1 Tax=Actinoplanes sp. NBRC 101535 TaxID=3032196 RepID=UPI002557B930|nr:hypothetical protein [Actinoplanes sp. NBRC 101535]
MIRVYRAFMRRASIVKPVIVLMSCTGLLTSVTGCSAAGPDPAAAPPATSPAANSAPTAPGDGAVPAVSANGAAPGSPASNDFRAACRIAAAMPRTGEAIEIDEHAIKTLIGYAQTTGVASIEQRGAELEARYSAWLASDIGDDSATALDDMLDTVGQINDACVQAAITVP